MGLWKKEALNIPDVVIKTYMTRYIFLQKVKMSILLLFLVE